MTLRRSPASVTGSILTLNAGSSSFKFAVFGQDGADGVTAMFRGQVTGLEATPHFVAYDAAGIELANRQWPEGRPPLLAEVLEDLLVFVEAHAGQGGRLAAGGHGVVHGGPTTWRRHASRLRCWTNSRR